MTAPKVAPKVSIVDQIAQAGVKPEQINFVGISHYHADHDGVPAFNYDRAQTVASIERLKKIAATFKATVIIQHDARDVGKLPAIGAK